MDHTQQLAHMALTGVVGAKHEFEKAVALIDVLRPMIAQLREPTQEDDDRDFVIMCTERELDARDIRESGQP